MKEIIRPVAIQLMELLFRNLGANQIVDVGVSGSESPILYDSITRGPAKAPAILSIAVLIGVRPPWSFKYLVNFYPLLRAGGNHRSRGAALDASLYPAFLTE